jgi:hypothetical protein
MGILIRCDLHLQQIAVQFQLTVVVYGLHICECGIPKPCERGIRKPTYKFVKDVLRT